MKRTMMIPALALAAVVHTALPAAVGAQEAESADRIAEAMIRAEAAGVPLALLESKRAEGRAKGVSPERLAEAMQRRADALIAAREAMPGSDAHALEAGADAVEAGIGPEVLGHIESTVPGERRYVAVYAVSRLVAAGHVPEAALVRVQEALARGPEAMGWMVEHAQGARARRGPPEGFGPSSMPGPMDPPAGMPGPRERPVGRPGGPSGGPPGGGL